MFLFVKWKIQKFKRNSRDLIWLLSLSSLMRGRVKTFKINFCKSGTGTVRIIRVIFCQIRSRYFGCRLCRDWNQGRTLDKIDRIDKTDYSAPPGPRLPGAAWWQRRRRRVWRWPWWRGWRAGWGQSAWWAWCQCRWPPSPPRRCPCWCRRGRSPGPAGPPGLQVCFYCWTSRLEGLSSAWRDWGRGWGGTLHSPPESGPDWASTHQMESSHTLLLLLLLLLQTQPATTIKSVPINLNMKVLYFIYEI